MREPKRGSFRWNWKYVWDSADKFLSICEVMNEIIYVVSIFAFLVIFIPWAFYSAHQDALKRAETQVRIEAQAKVLKAQEEAELQALIGSQVEQGDDAMIEYLMRQVDGE